MKGVIIVIAAAVLALLAGCVSTGRPLREEQVKSLVPGKSTKSDLMDLFGAPAALAARNVTLSLPHPAIMGAPFANRFSNRIDPETFFVLFPPADEYRRIYYYYHAVSGKHPVWYLVYFGERGKTVTDRLWVLVDERTGTVVDYAFKKYEKDTIFGLPRSKPPEKAEDQKYQPAESP